MNISRLTFCIAFILSGIIPVPGSYAQQLPSLDSVTLQLKWKHQFQFAGYYAAVEKGFFQEEGLAVKILEAPADGSSFEPVLAGEAEFGIAMSDLILLRAKGHPVVALGAIYQHSPLIVLAPEKSGIDTVHDLLNRKLMIEHHAAEILAYLETENLPASKLILYPHTFDISQILNGDIDAMTAYSTDEPFLLKEKGIKYNVFSARAGGIDFYGDILFTMEEQIKKHPKRVLGFLKASTRGWEYALNHSEEIIELILTHYSRRHSREHLKFEADQTKHLIISDVVEVGYMNPGRWKHISEIYRKMNMISGDVSLDEFLYDKNPLPDLSWFYWTLAGLTFLGSLGFMVSARFYKLNRNLALEIKQREELQNKLFESERSKSNLLKNLQGMAYRCRNDLHWTMKYVSDGCEDLTGYQAEALLENAQLSYNDIILREDKSMVSSNINEALREFRPYQLTYRIKTRTGIVKWVWEQGRGIFSPEGDLLYLEGFITDISLQKKVEEEKEQALDKLEEQSRLLEEKSGQLETHNRQMLRDLNLAGGIQRHLFQTDDVPAFITIATCFIPYSHISGDIYKIYMNSNNHLNLFIGDGTGHGLEAALSTMMVNALLTQYPDERPMQLLRSVNKVLEKNWPIDRLMSAMHLQIHESGEALLATAGHPPLLIVSPNGNVNFWFSSNPFLGVGVDTFFQHEEQQFVLSPGDRGLLYTDGIIEWMNQDEEQFGVDALAKFFQEHRTMDPDEFLQTLLNHVAQNHAPGIPLSDDLTMILFEFHGVA
ncbi:MAG: ABC transporter substrate-binding protein [SAR324 cluster bacterium]|nr:ABC transporter substrate-binding protein [SAR324 cluster bacterium]